MKTITRMFAVAIAVLMMGFVFTACSSVEKDIQGGWFISTFNGMTREEYASSKGIPAYQVAINLTLTEDKAVFSSINGAQVFDVAYTKNGVDLMLNGNNAGSFVYDKAAQTLTINDASTGSDVLLVFKKGTEDLVAIAEQAKAEQEAFISGEGNNEGFTGADYGELTQEELDAIDRYIMNAGLTGADYGELTQAELDEIDRINNRNANANNNSGNNSNRNNSNTVVNGGEGNNAGFTGRDYGELTQAELDENDRANMNAGLTGRDYGELTQDEINEMERDSGNAGLTGRDYGELTQDEITEMERASMNAGLTGRDYGENAD